MTSLAGDAEQARKRFDEGLSTTPARAARVILAAVERDRRRTLIGPDAKVIDLLARLPAPLTQRLIVRMAQRQS